MVAGIRIDEAIDGDGEFAGIAFMDEFDDGRCEVFVDREHVLEFFAELNSIVAFHVQRGNLG
jgi:hypothetical protein